MVTPLAVDTKHQGFSLTVTAAQARVPPSESVLRRGDPINAICSIYQKDEEPTMFNYDWFHGSSFEQQRSEAKWRCALNHFPDVDPKEARQNGEFTEFLAKLDDRALIYLRDGFSYEIRGLADVDTKSHLVFECEPVDEQYKVGTFVVTVPFEEIVRVEVFAVHPKDKPEDMPQITGFRTVGEPGDHKHPDSKPAQQPRVPR